MCSIKCAFFGENNFNIIKMHGTTIKITTYTRYMICFGYIIVNTLHKVIIIINNNNNNNNNVGLEI
jgi:hypothetical protein